MPFIEGFERQMDRVELFFAKNKTINQWHLKKGFFSILIMKAVLCGVSEELKVSRAKYGFLNGLTPKKCLIFLDTNRIFLITQIW